MAVPALDRGDVVRVSVNDVPSYYGRVDRVVPGEPGWWRIDIVALTMPPHPIAWIITFDQLAGAPFVMNGLLHKVEKLAWMELPDEGRPKTEEVPPEPASPAPANVLDFSARLRKKNGQA